MPIIVKFFASLREQTGKSEQQLEISAPLSVAEVWNHAGNAGPLPANVLAAVNLEYVDADTPVHDGDEVAFFPPATGG